MAENGHHVPLPAAGDAAERAEERKGMTTLVEALADRRTERQFSAAPLSLQDVAELLWAAQGITGHGDKVRRTSTEPPVYLQYIGIANNCCVIADLFYFFAAYHTTTHDVCSMPPPSIDPLRRPHITAIVLRPMMTTRVMTKIRCMPMIRTSHAYIIAYDPRAVSAFFSHDRRHRNAWMPCG